MPTIDPGQAMQIISGLKNLGDYRLNQRAMNDLYRAFYFQLRKYCDNMISNHSEAEEIVHDSFVKMWEKRSNFENVYRIKTFLFNTARNSCIDYLRKKKTENKNNRLFSLIETENDVLNFEIVNSEEIMISLLDGLPPACREICFLTLVENLSTREVSEKTGKTLQNVSIQKKKGSKLLRNILLEKGLFPVTGFISIGVRVIYLLMRG